MNNKFWYRVFVLCVFVLLLSIGTIIGYNYSKNMDEIAIDDNNVYNRDNVINIYEDDVTSVISKKHDIKVEYIDYYTLCGEKITDSKDYYDTTIDDVKNNEERKQKENGFEYIIKEENNDKIIFQRSVDTYCPNHFKIILEDKNINVYRKITDKKDELYKKLDIPIETLRTEVVNELTGGILVNSEQELNMIIEDIES